MARTKVVGGKRVPMTPEEEFERDAEELAFQRFGNAENLRIRRQKKIAQNMPELIEQLEALWQAIELFESKLPANQKDDVPTKVSNVKRSFMDAVSAADST